MRKPLIALVLGATALTFYSALWFKSESIEDDITARVTEDLTSSGAQNIDIGVDGRHVTLTGIVYDEITEDAYLETADATYGALGPIDGLTFQADSGYVNAIKTAEGISLRGTVSNAEMRAKLVAEAEAATDGAVDDQLIVSGPEAAWQDEAAFGVSQLAGLTSGTLTAAAGAYALSGSTDADPDAVASGLADREGWKALISSSMETQGLSAEVERLNAEVGTITSDRDAIGVELADLKASLTQGEANTAELRGQLDAANSMIGEKDQTITTLTGQLTDGKAQIASLQTELDNRQAALGSTDDRIVALTGELDTATGKVADLTAQVTDRDASIAALTSDVASRDTTIAGLNDQVARLSSNADQSVAELTDGLAARDDKISELTASMSDRDQQIASLTGTVSERDDVIASLSAQVKDRDGSLASNVAQIAALSAAAKSRDADVSGLEGQVAELTKTVAARDETIAALKVRPVLTGGSAEQCAAQATGALEGSRINFETGSAQISDDSVELLERLTGIALACVSEDLSVDIGGHTDAQGSAENNQALSEARAQSVMAFMSERGVPAGGLRATGFGESQPVASNDTAEGRAQNRRISFDWQAR